MIIIFVFVGKSADRKENGMTQSVKMDTRCLH